MSPVEPVVKFLQENELVVATAESCTAGLVASMLADVAGCGAVLEGGYIVYSETAKHDYLGVSFATMDSYGLTSEAVARELVSGLAGRCNANYLIAITGTAESDDVLSGVVCIARGLKVNGCLRVISETKKFAGERNDVRSNAAHYVLESIPDTYQTLINQEV